VILFKYFLSYFSPYWRIACLYIIALNVVSAVEGETGIPSAWMPQTTISARGITIVCGGRVIAMNDETREAIHERDRGQCVNCSASGPDVILDVHHIVPRGRGGSDRLSNLALLCRQCHDAAHGEGTAPTVQFSSTGNMNSASFKVFLRFFSELPTARFDSETKAWRVPKADFERVVQAVNSPQESTAIADGGT
jgi:hypothetical protein